MARPTEQISSGRQCDLSETGLVRAARFIQPGETSFDARERRRRGGGRAEEFYRERWRHDKVVRSTHVPRLWSVVFPLAMYTVASFSLGRAAGFDFMISVTRVWVRIVSSGHVGSILAPGLPSRARHPAVAGPGRGHDDTAG